MHRNMPDAVATVSTPYAEPIPGPGAAGRRPMTSGGADPMKIEVTVHQHAGGTGRMFGVFDANVTARAVAERLPGDDTLAIFPITRCAATRRPRVRRGDVRINGFIHSNGRFRVSQGPFWAADGTISEQLRLEHRAGGVLAVRSAPPLNREPRDVFETKTWPLWHTPPDFGWLDGCTYSARRSRSRNPSWRSTAMCIRTAANASERHVLRDDVVPPRRRRPERADHGPVAADHGGGGDLELRPFAQDVLFFAVPNSDTTSSNDGSLAANGGASCVPSDGNDLVLRGEHRWFGLVFNPCGRIHANLGGGLDGAPAFEGAFVGLRVLLQGNGFEMIGRGDFEYSTALVE